MAKHKLIRRLSDAYKALTKADPLMRGHVTRSQMHAALNSRPVAYDELVIAYYSVPAVYTCVNLKATTVAQTPLRVYRKRKGDGYKTRPVSEDRRKAIWYSEKAREAVATDETLEEVTDPDHPCNMLLSKWNAIHNEYDGMYALATWLDLTGGAFIAPIVKSGTPVELIPLDVRKVWTIPDADRGWPYVVGYRYGESMVDATQEYGLDELVRIGPPSIYEPFRFHSAYASAINEVRQLYRFTEFNQTMLENGGAPGGVFKGGRWTNQDELDAFLEQVSNKFGGTLNSGRFMAVPEGMDYQQLEISKELSFILSDKEAQAKVYKAAGVPITLLENENANLAGAVRANPQFVAIAINPMLRQIEDAFNADDTLTLGGEVFYGFDPVNAEEAEDAAETVTLYQGGILYLNEARKRIGYDPIEGGDTFYEPPAAQTPTDPFAGFFAQRALQSPQIAFDAPATPKPSEAPKALPEPSIGQTATKHTLLTDLLYGCAPDCGCENAEPPKGHRGTKDDRRDVDKRDGYAEASRRIEAQMRDVLGPLYNQALTIAASSATPEQAQAGILRLFDAEGATVREAVREPLLDMFSRGYADGIQTLAKETGADLGAFEVLSDDAINAFDSHLIQLGDDIGETTARAISEQVRTGIANGATPKETAALIREKVPELAGYRAERIARTETANALLEGERNSWRDTDLIEGRQFSLSTAPCPLCKAVADKWRGKTAGIDEPWVKAGETINGVVFNRDAYGTIHPNCNCAQRVVPKDFT